MRVLVWVIFFFENFMLGLKMVDMVLYKLVFMLKGDVGEESGGE